MIYVVMFIFLVFNSGFVLGLKIFRLQWLKVVFEADINKS